MRKILLLLVSAILILPAIAVSSNEQVISAQVAILKSRAEHKEKWQAKGMLVKIGNEALQSLIAALKDGSRMGIGLFNLLIAKFPDYRMSACPRLQEISSPTRPAYNP